MNVKLFNRAKITFYATLYMSIGNMASYIRSHSIYNMVLELLKSIKIKRLHKIIPTMLLVSFGFCSYTICLNY